MSTPATTSQAAALGGSSDPAGRFLAVGVVGLAIAAAGLAMGLSQGDERPLLSWLLGIAFWLSVSIGMLFMVMIFYVFDAGWSVIVRRTLEHALAGMKWLGLLFLPLVAVVWFYEDPGILWRWMNPANPIVDGGTVGTDVLYLKKTWWLDKGVWTVRTLLFFGLWITLVALLRKVSFSNDTAPSALNTRRGRVIAAVGIITTALSASFGAIDWFKSLEYHWFSTMYGVWFFAASMWSGIAVTILLYSWLAKGPLQGLAKPSHVYFLGCMQLAFTVFWAYISFSQYFLIYSANIPEETFWYNLREKGPWFAVSMVLIFGHFFVPFLYLLFYKSKFGTRILAICCWILLMHLVDLYWNIVPGKIPADNELGYVVRGFGGPLGVVLDLAMIIGVGGLLGWAFFRSYRTTKPIPVNDPRILEALNHHE